MGLSIKFQLSHLIAVIMYPLVPIIFGIALVLKIIISKLNITKAKKIINIISSVLATLFLGSIWAIGHGGPPYSLNEILVILTPPVFFILALLVLMTFFLLQITDLILPLKFNEKLIIILFILVSFIFLYPKKSHYSNYNSQKRYWEVKSCLCLGVPLEISCLGVPVFCKINIDLMPRPENL